MKWKKLGHIFSADKQHAWMQSHAANTVAQHLNDDLFRIFFSTRDNENHSCISFIDVDINPPFHISRIADSPCLCPGDTGLFDDSGTSLSCMVNVDKKIFVYYLGWNLGVTVPWRNSIGLAIGSQLGEKFEKYSLAPLMDRDDTDPYSISYPFVLADQGIYKMWYGSNLKWGKNQNEMAHVIKYAESPDGIHWKRNGHVAIAFKDDSEYAISRPFVLKENGLYKMWYSFRGPAYRIGYAESTNGVDWNRMDEHAGIDVSSSGWDSDSVEYPFIFDHKGHRYMLYNGNKYGLTGFGLAVLQNE